MDEESFIGYFATSCMTGNQCIPQSPHREILRMATLKIYFFIIKRLSEEVLLLAL